MLWPATLTTTVAMPLDPIPPAAIMITASFEYDIVIKPLACVKSN